MTTDPIARRDAALAEVETATAELQLAELRRDRDLIENWTPVVESAIDSDDWTPVSDPRRHAGLGARVVSARYTSVRDRADGRYHPYYEDEYDLREQRLAVRNAGHFSTVCQGAIALLGQYVLGNGMTFDAEMRQSGADEIAEVRDLRAWIADFVEANGFAEGFCEEMHSHVRLDGDRLAVLYPGERGIPRVGQIEPEQITEPARVGDLNSWLGIPTEEAFWDFGVLTRYSHVMRTNDLERPLGYHIVFDDGAGDWDYIAASRAVHFRRNVPRSAKRGVSDVLLALADIEGEGKINRNLQSFISILTCIPFFKEYERRDGPRGVDVRGGDIVNRTRGTTDGGPRVVKSQRYHPGTVPELYGGKFTAGPLSQTNNASAATTLDIALRRIGQRWTIPLFMLTGETTTALYSAVLVIGSPFVKARVADQEWFGTRFVDLIRKAVVYSHARGELPPSLQRLDIGRFLSHVARVTYDAQDVALESGLERAQRQEVELRSGTLSLQTATEGAGRSWDEERMRGARPASSGPGMLEAMRESIGWEAYP